MANSGCGSKKATVVHAKNNSYGISCSSKWHKSHDDNDTIIAAAKNKIKDCGIRLHIHSSSYFGRQQEQQKLESIYNNNIHNKVCVTISGKAGSGKSSLVEALQKSTLEKHQQPDGSSCCLYGSGKYQLHGTAEPYLGIVEAFNGVISMWESQPEGAEEILKFVQQTQANKDILKEVIPRLYKHEVDLSRHAGNGGNRSGGTAGTTTSPLPPINNALLAIRKTITHSQKPDNKPRFDRGNLHRSKEARNRANAFECLMICLRLLIRNASKQNTRRIVLFLDDVQWADELSFKTLQHLLHTKNGCDGLVIIVTYRTEEVTLDHSLLKTIERIKESPGCAVEDIEVKEFTLSQVNDILSSLTRRKQVDTMSLAAIIHEKTLGNAFFVFQFLRLLQDECQLYYCFTTLSWKWIDVDQIKDAFAILSGDVADAVTPTLMQLSPITQEILKVASCLGSEVPLLVLEKYFDSKSSVMCFDNNTMQWPTCKDTKTVLVEAMDAAVGMNILRQRHAGTEKFDWSHDKIQQAAYSMIPADQQQRLHMTIGFLLWQLSSEYPHHQWMVYMAADQLGRGSDLITEPQLKLQVLQLHLQAAKISVSRSALFPAATLLRRGIQFLDEDTKWNDETYDLTLKLHNNLAEIELLLSNLERCSAVVEDILKHAKTLTDKYEAHCIFLGSFQQQSSEKGALEQVYDILALYGEVFPRNPGRLAVMLEKSRFKKDFPNHKMTDLPNLPDMTDESAIRLCNLLGKVSYGCAVAGERKRNIMHIASFRLLRLCFKYGMHSFAAAALFGPVVSAVHQRRLTQAYELSLAAAECLRRFRDSPGDVYAHSILLYYGTSIPTIRPFQESLDPFMDAHNVGVLCGELKIATCAAMNYGYCYILSGLTLEPLQADLLSFQNEAEQFGVPQPIQVMFSIFRQVTDNFCGRAENPSLLIGQSLDSNKLLSTMQGPAKSMTLRDISIFQLMLAYFFDDLETCNQMIFILADYPIFNIVFARTWMRQLFTGLACFSLYRQTNKKKYNKQGKAILKEFESDVKRGSFSAHPAYVLLHAEENPSRERYQEAIKVLGRSGVTHFEALANELAGRHFLSVDNHDVDWAKHYMVRALYLYSDWGANGKVAQLKKRYPSLLLAEDGENFVMSTSLGARARYNKKHLRDVMKFGLGMSKRDLLEKK